MREASTAENRCGCIVDLLTKSFIATRRFRLLTRYPVVPPIATAKSGSFYYTAPNRCSWRLVPQVHNCRDLGVTDPWRSDDTTSPVQTELAASRRLCR